ncbi:OBSCN protein, partial [Crypturellus soui]|nr:OBSCN protein [Crypturellus soui]
PVLLCYTEEEAVIVTDLKHTHVFANESATFTCDVSCPGLRNAQWWLDGSPLHNNFVTKISEQDGTVHTLSLMDMACHDLGTDPFGAVSLLPSTKLLVRSILLLA